MNDDNPTISFGSKVENLENEEVPPFYLSLNVHDMVVHNAMLDSGASHNLMPKGVVESLGLEVTRPYKDLYSFDSRRVKWSVGPQLECIKSLCKECVFQFA